MEVFAMQKLGPVDVSPRIIDYFWMDAPVKLSDLAPLSFIVQQQEERPSLDPNATHEGVGVVVMQTIDGFNVKGPIALLDTEIRKAVRLKMQTAYNLGFIPQEPDIFMIPEECGNFNIRILDWGGFSGYPSYSEIEYQYVMDYLMDVHE